MAVEATTDGGQTFRTLPPPVRDIGAKGWVVDQMRFADATTGWAYGGNDGPALFATVDGGATWATVADIPGPISDLVAANGTAWAVADVSALNSSGPQYALYSTRYGTGPQQWSKVALPIDLGSTATPSIVDQDGVITVLAAGPARASGMDYVLISTDGSAFTVHDGPCSQSGTGYLSNSQKAIWVSCPSGLEAQYLLSTDRGTTWHSAAGVNFHDTSYGNLGAVDDQYAISYDNGPHQLVRVPTSGAPQPVADLGANALSPAFIGFTTATTGFALMNMQDGTAQLLHTTDAGSTWTPVTFPS